MPFFFLTAVTGSFDAATDTDLKHLATFGIRTIEQACLGTNGLIADHIRGLLHGIGLYDEAESAEELITVMLIHQTEGTVVVECGIALRLLHRLLERGAGAALETVLMDKITTTEEVLLIEAVLHNHVLHAYLAIGIAYIYLGLPLVVAKTDADAEVRDSGTAFQFVFLFLGLDVGCIEKDTPRRLDRDLRLFLCIDGCCYHKPHCHHQ